jgi:hypothetical protein
MVLNRGTSTYFNNFHSSREQQLLEDLIIESIKIYGQDMLYIPRNIESFDELYTEDDQSSYTKAYPIEMYIKSVDGFEGDGVFLSKFGLEIRDQVTFTVAKRIFEEEIKHDSNQLRPTEGSLIYFPLNAKLFQIKYVNYKPFFYQLGALQTYDLVCELFEYSGQVVDTGYEEVDIIQKNYSTNIFDYSLLTEDGKMLIAEDGATILNESYEIGGLNSGEDTNIIQETQENGVETDQQSNANNNIVDWTYFDPFSEGKYSVALLALLNSSIIYKLIGLNLWKTMIYLHLV